MSSFEDSFVANLAKRAVANQKWIVLSEATDERVLRVIAQVLQDGSAEVIFIGEKAEVDTKARVLGMDLPAAMVVSLDDTTRLNHYVPELVELRQHRGVTEEKARETLKDIFFFTTIMTVCGDANGMASDAAHITVHTIRPALRVVKTCPGVEPVSDIFLMVFNDRFDAYSDCAVTIAPTAEQLADIAVVLAVTATQLGLESKVAMLSYPTISSGTGPMVNLVHEAVALAKAAVPEMVIDGPLQSDVAVAEPVAAKKTSGSKAADRVNTFIFPDLDADSITYKAIQRASGILAIGPVLQSLNTLVNGLSRGATVDNIINTVVITAVQAQD